MRSRLPLYHLSIWIQVYDLPSGFRSQKICQAIRSYVDEFIKFDSKIFRVLGRNLFISGYLLVYVTP